MSTLATETPGAAETISLPLELTPEQTELRARARRFVDEVLIPHEEEAERLHGRLPQETIDLIKREAIAANLNGFLHSPEYGGQGWTRTEWVLVEEQLGRSTNGVYWHIPNAYNVWDNASEAQRERYLRPAIAGELKDAYAVTEAEAGSDPSGISTLAERTDAGYRINGEKWFVTSGDVAQVLIVMANVVDGDDRLPTLFLVESDAPGVEYVDDPPFTHNYPEGHPAIRFTDVEVGEDAVVGEVGAGDELQRKWFTEERLAIAARGVGRDVAPARRDGRLGLRTPAGRLADLRLPGGLLPARRLGRRRGGRPAARALGRDARRRRRRPEDRPPQGVDGEAVRLRGGLALRRPLRAGLRRAWLHAHQRRRALPARAQGRPDLGGHERDPAADRRPRPRAPRGRAHPALRPSLTDSRFRPQRMDLTPLLAPRSIAVVGATDRPDSYAGNVLRNLERAGFEGPVWGVNPKREQVLGRACVPSVGELPEAVDAVVVAIPAPGVPAAIRDSVERGCGGAVVLSAGFGEVEEGRALEAELREAALRRQLPGLRAERQRDHLGRGRRRDVG